jgi:hypothetical protein
MLLLPSLVSLSDQALGQVSQGIALEIPPPHAAGSLPNGHVAAEILELLGHPTEAGVFALAGLNDQFSVALEAKGPPEGFGQRGVRSLSSSGTVRYCKVSFVERPLAGNW